MLYDLIIIGGATAGLSAAIYAARKKLKFILLTDEIGGQSLLTNTIENYPGFKLISGEELIKKMKEHAESLGTEIKEGARVKQISKISEIFEIKMESEDSYKTKTVLINTGKHPRSLNIPGEKEFTGKGVSYCSICDAPLFQGKRVAVVGGGNAGLEAVLDLLKYATQIYVLEFDNKIKGDESSQEKLRESGKVEFMTSVKVQEIKGEKFAQSLIYKDLKTNEQKELKLEGIFVNIGQVPNSEFVRDLVKLNEAGEIMIDCKTNQTSIEGIFAAGDVSDIPFKQCVIAAGEGVKAVLSAHNYLLKTNKF